MVKLNLTEKNWRTPRAVAIRGEKTLVSYCWVAGELFRRTQTPGEQPKFAFIVEDIDFDPSGAEDVPDGLSWIACDGNGWEPRQ